MWSVLTLHTHTHLGEELSLRIVLRWKREGAKHNGQVSAGHLVLTHAGRYITQEAQQSLQGFAVLVW